jgi:hypothetical protein
MTEAFPLGHCNRAICCGTGTNPMVLHAAGEGTAAGFLRIRQICDGHHRQRLNKLLFMQRDLEA